MNGSSSSFPELWNAPSQVGTFFLPGVDVISKDGGNSISHLKYSSVTSTLPLPEMRSVSVAFEAGLALSDLF